MSVLRIVTELARNGALLLALLRKEMAVRYKQSVVGPLWALLQPLILMGLFVMVQSFVHIDSWGAPYPLVVYAALLPWTLFASAVNVATASIVGNAAIIRKMRCPRAAFPLAAILPCFVDFFIAFFFLLALLAYYRTGLSWHAALLPLLLLLQLLLIFGLVLLTSSIAAYRRDVLIAMPHLLNFLMFASPVMYRIESVPERWRSLYALNPMAGIIEAHRSILVYGSAPDPSLLLPATAVAAGVFAVGLAVFARLEERFADVV